MHHITWNIQQFKRTDLDVNILREIMWKPKIQSGRETQNYLLLKLTVPTATKLFRKPKRAIVACFTAHCNKSGTGGSIFG
jgi:hypothetical protein